MWQNPKNFVFRIQVLKLNNLSVVIKPKDLKISSAYHLIMEDITDKVREEFPSPALLPGSLVIDLLRVYSLDKTDIKNPLKELAENVQRVNKFGSDIVVLANPKVIDTLRSSVEEPEEDSDLVPSLVRRVEVIKLDEVEPYPGVNEILEILGKLSPSQVAVYRLCHFGYWTPDFTFVTSSKPEDYFNQWFERLPTLDTYMKRGELPYRIVTGDKEVFSFLGYLKVTIQGGEKVVYPFNPFMLSCERSPLLFVLPRGVTLSEEVMRSPYAHLPVLSDEARQFIKEQYSSRDDSDLPHFLNDSDTSFEIMHHLPFSLYGVDVPGLKERRPENQVAVYICHSEVSDPQPLHVIPWH